MESLLSCIPCIIKQVAYTARSVSSDGWLQKKVVSATIRDLADIEYTVMPVTLGNRMFKAAADSLGVTDPFQEQRREITDNFTDLLERIKARSGEVDDDELQAALKMSAAANHFPAFINLDETLDSIIQLARTAPVVFENERFSKEYHKNSRAVFLSGSFLELPFDVHLLSLLEMKEICLTASAKSFLWQASAEDMAALEGKLPFEPEIRTIGYNNPRKDAREIIQDEELIISKGFINYQYFEDYEGLLLYLFYANRWCQPSMISLGFKNKPRSGIVMKFSV